MAANGPSRDPWRSERVPRPSDPDWPEVAAAEYRVPAPTPIPERFAPPPYIAPPPSTTVPHGFPKPKIRRLRVALRVALAAAVFAALIAVGLAFRGNRLPFIDSIVNPFGDPTPVLTAREDLTAGMCLKLDAGSGADAEPLTDAELPVVNCESQHNGEVYGSVTLAKGNYPGPAAIQEKALERCGALIGSYQGEHSLPVITDLRHAYPTRTQWADGQRTVICLMIDLNGTHAGSLKG
jgi:hypothetical protein